MSEHDIRALWANPLFQLVRADIEKRSLKTRLEDPRASSPEAIKDALLFIEGLEYALKLFDTAVKSFAGPQKKTGGDE